MPKIIIDDREIEVAAGTKVIEAAEKLGIMIPRFCFHPALGSVGACRVCAVKFLQGPFKGVQMSCMIDAKDGMVVSTTDPEAVGFRRYVIEWLMLNHPHDCPVCDEGGHCLLQDMTVSGGHGIRRYRGQKRTFNDQYLGPLLQHEMNRCIQCYRCSRFYREFTGYRDLGVMNIGHHVYFGRYREGVLESPFCGNLGDICPTGVYTDKPSRFVGRRWDYERHPFLCINCALGCHTTVSCRYRQVVRQEARFSHAVNGHFICDRGRYGFFYTDLEQRPRRARIDGQTAAFDQTVHVLGQRLQAVRDRAGAQAVAWAGSLRNSLETQAMLKRLCQTKGWRPPAYFVDSATAQKVVGAVLRFAPGLMVSLREIESADFIAVVGVDAINEAPMLALAMRQAQRNEAKVVVIDPRPVFLPFEFDHLPAKLDAINGCLAALIKAAMDSAALAEQGPSEREFYEALAETEQAAGPHHEKLTLLAEKLRISRRPVIVCATETVRRQTPVLAADGALLLQAAGKQAGLFYLMPGANALAAGLLSDAGTSFEALVGDIEQGTIRALVLVESNPFWQFPDRTRLEKALQRLELLAVMDYLDSAAARLAHILLPTATVYEAGGVFINQEGRVQAARPAYRDGIPIAQTGAGDHPPRLYAAGLPGAQARSAWQVLAELAGVESDSEKNLRSGLWDWLVETVPGFAGLPRIAALGDEGIRIEPGASPPARFAPEGIAAGAAHALSFELIPAERTFGTEELSAHSACLNHLAGRPFILMHSSDAQKLRLSDGERLSIALHGGALEALLRTADNMAPGTLIIPRHKDLDWQKMNIGLNRIGPDQIRKLKNGA
jgi:NADH-quinone oxidoreductase subunit G